jgi:hypothetical protein
VGRAGVAVSGYGAYRGYQWLLNSSLNWKVAATESDLLPFLDLLKLQSLRQSDYRDVLHFCIDRRFFVTQFPASPPHKFKRAVPALYDLIQSYGTANETKFMDIEEFFASPAVQSLFFENEEDYKLIEYEFYGSVAKQKLDVSIKTMQEMWLLVQNPDKIVHIFDSPSIKANFIGDERVVIFTNKWIPEANQKIDIISHLNDMGEYEIRYPVFRKFEQEDVRKGKDSIRLTEIAPPFLGVSCNTDLSALKKIPKKNGIVLVILSLPYDLIVKQKGEKITHCVIVPRNDNMSKEDFEKYFYQIKWREFRAR